MSRIEIDNAEREIEMGNAELDSALGHLQEKLEVGAGKVGNALDVARHPGDHIRGYVDQFVTERRDQVSATLGNLRSTVRTVTDEQLRVAARNPVASSLVAFTGGALLGALTGGLLLRMFGRPRLPALAVQEFVDKCTARWLFEKNGVLLYEQAVLKCPLGLREKLLEIRDEEKSHEEMLEDVIRSYGYDPHSLSKSARITDIESQGIVNVVMNEDFSAVIDALLAAELVDNANWDLLCKLAKEIGDRKALGKFRLAQAHEAEHLLVIREQVINDSIEKIERAVG